MTAPALIRHGRPDLPVLAPVEVTARTVRVGDVLVVGDARRTVGDMHAMGADRRHVLFAEGGTLVVGAEPLPALRPQPPGQLAARPSGWRL